MGNKFFSSAKELLGRLYLLGLFELSMIFQDLGNMVFRAVYHRLKKINEKAKRMSWFDLITLCFIFSLYCSVAEVFIKEKRIKWKVLLLCIFSQKTLRAESFHRIENNLLLCPLMLLHFSFKCYKVICHLLKQC